MCDRNMNGSGLNPHINLAELTLSDCENIFNKPLISQLNSMYMCGNLGDPIIANDTLSVFEYFRNTNNKIWLGMNTNGGARSSDWWRNLADILGARGVVTFSIDGLEDTNHIYRQNVIWSNIIKNAKSFIAAGGHAKWDFLIFDHNQHQLEQAEFLSKKLGFEKFVAKKTGRFLYANTAKKDEHISYNKNDKFSIKKPKDEYTNNSLKKQDNIINKYKSMDNYYDQTLIQCKVKDEGSLFITAEGLAFPCCWTAGRMYKWWHKDPTIEQIWNFIEEIGGKEKLNAKNGLENVFKTGIFENIERSWSKKNCSDGKLKVCSMKCGIGFDPFGDQFK
ncbi:MAG: hypothetical protein CO117_03895 [Flavobacteriaceae bacterium CG_4_9_14_3_um_filter_33_16]|nr:MAG: hypothetical protein CO117_03895 [Flavobacteriaceae bacterium CG_4_9_14_3_um_filter_33_16]